MRGVSEVIAIILILMITISLAGLAYMFMSTTMSDVTSSAGSTVDTTTSSMLTSFTIESMDVAKLYVRNTGQNTLTSLSVYVNDEPATYNVTTPIAAGAVGTITIYSFIPDGATVKVTSPSGFSTSKVARPCEKAVGCWDFDEASGTTAYDSSPYGNTGTLINGPTWANGKYGNSLSFDGSNDYVNITDNPELNSNVITFGAWFKTSGTNDYSGIITKYNTTSGYSGFILAVNWNSVVRCDILYTSSYSTAESLQAIEDGRWHYAVCSYNGSVISLYVDGVKTVTNFGVGLAPSIGYPLKIGQDNAGRYFNGTIDEIRVYNRAIY